VLIACYVQFARQRRYFRNNDRNTLFQALFGNCRQFPSAPTDRLYLHWALRITSCRRSPAWCVPIPNQYLSSRNFLEKSQFINKARSTHTEDSYADDEFTTSGWALDPYSLHIRELFLRTWTDGRVGHSVAYNKFCLRRAWALDHVTTPVTGSSLGASPHVRRSPLRFRSSSSGR